MRCAHLVTHAHGVNQHSSQLHFAAGLRQGARLRCCLQGINTRLMVLISGQAACKPSLAQCMACAEPNPHHKLFPTLFTVL